MFYRWASLENFEAWHVVACLEVGIPHPGRNAATGELDTDEQWTTAYTTPTVVAAGDERAVVEAASQDLTQAATTP